MACQSYGSRPNYFGEWQKCERELCAARWILLNLVKICDAQDISIPSTLRIHIELETTKQIKHRKMDKNFIKNNLESQVIEVDRNIEDIKSRGGLPGRALLLKKKKLIKKIDEINALSDNDLLEGSWINPVTPIDTHS